MSEKSKILCIDISEVFFTSVFANRRMRMIPGIKMVMSIEWLVLRKIFSYIRAYPDREVYLMGDGKNSWRKEVDPNYKGQRKEQREKYEDIDWDDLFKRYSQLISTIDTFTPMNVYIDDLLEADDLEAILALDGNDLVIFSSDKDLNQLTIYPGVTLISPKKKKVKNKFVVREVTEPLKELDKLVRCGDKADNIPPAKTEAQKVINNKLVNLISLPQNIIDRGRLVLIQPRYKDISYATFCSFYKWGFVQQELERRWPLHDV